MPATATGDRACIPADVAAVFDRCREPIRAELLGVRDLILATASETAGVGPITETLRWGQPAYLTTETGSGSTIRIAPTRPDSEHDYGVFFTCHTNLVDGFSSIFGETFDYDGGRALLFRSGDSRPESELRECVAMALTYHQPRR